MSGASALLLALFTRLPRVCFPDRSYYRLQRPSAVDLRCYSKCVGADTLPRSSHNGHERLAFVVTLRTTHATTGAGRAPRPLPAPAVASLPSEACGDGVGDSRGSCGASRAGMRSRAAASRWSRRRISSSRTASCSRRYATWSRRASTSSVWSVVWSRSGGDWSLSGRVRAVSSRTYTVAPSFTLRSVPRFMRLRTASAEIPREAAADVTHGAPPRTERRPAPRAGLSGAP